MPGMVKLRCVQKKSLKTSVFFSISVFEHFSLPNERMKGMERQNHGISPRRYLTSGPLVLDAVKSFAIIDGERLPLNETQVDALYLLMQREGCCLKFEQLYDSLWSSTGNEHNRDVARAELDQLVETLNASGKGAVRIERTPEGYEFLTLKP